MEHHKTGPSEGGNRLPLLLILGMVNGFSVWMITVSLVIIVCVCLPGFLVLGQ